MPRPPTYDRAEVVDQAMAVFWERGYSQTSIGHLVEATGLKPGSLYAAFGSKKGVFLEVLDEYNKTFLAKIRKLDRGHSTRIGAIHDMLSAIADDSIAGRDRRGCLSVNALLEMAQHDDDIARHLDRHNGRVRQAFAEVIGDAQAAGELHPDRAPDEVAAFLVNNIWGLRVMCKTNPDAATLGAIVDGIVAGLGGAGSGA